MSPSPASRWPHSSSQERAAFSIVESICGVTVDEWDVPGRSGVVDGRLSYPDGRSAALEVMALAGERALHLASKIDGEPVLPAPGVWSWLLQPSTIAEYEWISTRYADLILLCEAHGAPRPADLPMEVRHANPDVSAFVRTRINLVGSPLLAAGESPVVRMVAPGMSGTVDLSLRGLHSELAAAYQTDVFERHLAKLGRDSADEKHLFIPVHYTAFSFAVADGLMRGTLLPSDDPPADSRLTHLWLASHFGRILLWDAAGGWQQHHIAGGGPAR